MPCNTEAPYLEKNIWQAYRDRGVQVIGVNREQTAVEVEKFIAKHHWTFPTFLDPQREFYQQFTPKFIPWNVIVDQNGTIQYSEPGFHPDRFYSILENLLQSKGETPQP